jgi:hypothetical protein
VNEYCDYKNFDWDFDFDFLPDEDVWAQDHNNIWPSQHQKDSGTWLCSKEESEIIIYRTDVSPVKRRNEKNSYWKVYTPIDESKFDFSWHPDPTDPPFIYVWGNKYINGVFEPTIEYHSPDAVEKKYMFQHAPVLPQWERWHIIQEVDKTKFDFTWRPDPREPPYIYVWGNKHITGELQSTLEYHTPGATECKYMEELLEVTPQWDRWIEHIPVDKKSFDFSWRPDPREPAFNYVWANKYEPAEIKPTLEYRMPGATEIKYMSECVEVLPQWDKWKFLHDVDKNSFDFSWRPDPREPAFIYVFGNQWYDATVMPTIEYHCEGATEKKYIIDEKLVVKLSQKPENFVHLENAYLEDYSWVPDPGSPPYIYAFGNQWNKPEDKVSIQFVVPGATDYKYMVVRAIRKADKSQWIIPENVDTSDIDFSWEPSPKEPPYVYYFPTQWQKTGGVKYVVPDAIDSKFIDSQKVKALPTKNNWTVPKNIDVTGFDFSWHPDDLSPPFIYIFATQWALTGGPIYTVPGATEKKYVDYPFAIALPDKSKWIIPDNIDISDFDFSWHPFAEDDPCVYQIGTQWQKTGGPRYIADGTNEFSPVKYIDRRIIKSKRLPDKTNFKILHPIIESEFDFSWHPDETEEPYIYVFGNQHYPAEKMPTVEYHVEGATQYKFIDNIKAKLASNKTNWKINIPIAESEWDFTWVPDPGEPPYIYVFGNQWNNAEVESTIEYHVPGAEQRKYMNDIRATVLPDMNSYKLNYKIDKKSFDFSWRPDPGSPPYIYVFGSNLYPATEMSCVEYKVKGATDYKYMNNITATLAPDKSKWIVPDNIDVTDFDFSWHPNPKDPPYIYHAGTQWQKSGGPKYIVEGATEIKFLEDKKAKALPNKDNWTLPKYIDEEAFDFSWHPDITEPAYIYYFPTQWALTGGPCYTVPGATEKKYLEGPIAKAIISMENWEIPEYIDKESFDFSWHPYEEDIPFVYHFGTQHQKTGGPKYHTPGSDSMSPIKYVDRRIIKSKALPRPDKFSVYDGIKIKDFDYSWHPDDTEQPYIYVFGNKLYPAEIMPTVKYVVEGATQIKYISNVVATLDDNKENWVIPENIDLESFDFSWKPNPLDPPYIYEFATVHNNRGGPRYVVENATEFKYIEDIKAKLLPSRKNWIVPKNIDVESFDLSWVPHPDDPPYIYEFGTQWQKTGGPQYVVEGATEKKYVNSSHAIRKSNKYDKNWKIIHDIADFDFSWHPDETEEPYIYVFGNQWHDAIKMPTVEYHTPGATEKKFINDVKATLKPKREKFKELIKIAKDGFDFSWTPDPDEPPYIYVFGNQWNDGEIEPTIEYKVKDATETKYVNIKAKVAGDYKKFKTLLPVGDFDYSWRPNPKDPPYIYVFGNQWYDAVKEPTIEYRVPGAIDKKYINEIKATVLPDMTNWVIPKGCNVTTFDFSWHPDPDSPKYIYQFGTLSNDEDGPRYITPKNNGEVVRLQRVEVESVEEVVQQYQIQTTLEDLINQHPNEVFWATNKNINYENFDFDWRPSIEQARYVHVFGSPDSTITQTYFVSAKMYLQGYKDFNFVENTKADSEYLSKLFVQSDMFFVDRGNSESLSRFEMLKQKYPSIQKTRFLNSWVDTINRCINRSNTQLCWILNSELDYSDFNFNYYPDPWQLNMVHVFGTQWSHWGTTFMVNKDTFSNDTKYIKIIEHLSNLNFVKTIRAKATNNLYDVYVINHGNKELDQVVDSIKRVTNEKNVTVVDYDRTYLNTIKNIVDNIFPKKEHYIWICSSICNYNNFDFTYICDPFARENLHVFPSDSQKFGDTFFIDVNYTKKVINDLELLQQYDKVNYNGTIRTKRIPAPVIKVNSDTHTESINFDFDFPYAIFATEEFKSNDVEVMNLWQDDTKELLVTSTGASRIVVPKEAKNYIKNELYDYPYIKTASKLLSSKPLDIVFLSNGEKNAEDNYKHLLAVTEGLKNRVVRVDGINGRVEAYHAAVKASETPWAFTVFAKLKINPKFDWGWQPDRLQIPKHYIFHAKNPINGLEYGHQGMIAYNKQLVLNNFGNGLDFTLDDPHETVELVSGVANFNTDAYSTWRTAFREVIKLKSDYTEISQERLNIWLTEAKGKFAKDCLQGAKDAIEYYEEVSGDIDQLKLSYEWSWLKDYYNRKYK